MKLVIALFTACWAVAIAQQVGQYSPEEHPPITMQVCSKDGGCKSENAGIVLDFHWRWMHKVGGYAACMNDGKWDPDACPDNKTCAQNCALEGVSITDYDKNYGVTTEADSFTLKFSQTTNARVYLGSSDPTKYRMFYLLNQEFAFDVDMTKLECGMSGALYFAPMHEDGGSKEYPTAVAGAKYGLDYCDAQCGAPRFIEGLANFGMPTASGQYGLCCAEMDLWEANKASTVFTSHPVSKPGYYMCSDDIECGNGDNFYKGVADKGGCGFNAYGNGNHSFYGPGSNFTVDTNRKFTVVTQFLTDDNTAKGKLVEIRRLYKQDGKVIGNSVSTKLGMDSITDAYCHASAWSPDADYHTKHGGLAGIGEELRNGMVLTASVGTAGDWMASGTQGPCPAGSDDWKKLQTMGQEARFSNIRIGDIGTTYVEDGPATTPVPTTSTPEPTTAAPEPTTATPEPTTNTPDPTTATPEPTTSAPEPTTGTPVPTEEGVPLYYRCGGIDYTGPTTCAQGTCKKWNDWYWQCV